MIYREGQLDDCMYFLHEGEVELSILLLTADQKSRYGAYIKSDPSVTEDRSSRGKTAAEAVRWVGRHSDRYRFFRWGLSSKTRAYFGEGVLRGDVSLTSAQ